MNRRLEEWERGVRALALAAAILLMPTFGFAYSYVYTAPLRAVNTTPTCVVTQLAAGNLAVRADVYDASGTSQCNFNVAMGYGATNTLPCSITGLSTCVVRVDTNGNADNLRVSYQLRDANGGAVAAVGGTRLSTVTGANNNPWTPGLIASSTTGKIECAVVNGFSTNQTVQLFLNGTYSSIATLATNQILSVAVSADGTGTTPYICEVLLGSSGGTKLFSSEYLQPGSSATDSVSPVSNTP